MSDDPFGALDALLAAAPPRRASWLVTVTAGNETRQHEFEDWERAKTAMIPIIAKFVPPAELPIWRESLDRGRPVYGSGVSIGGTWALTGADWRVIACRELGSKAVWP